MLKKNGTISAQGAGVLKQLRKVNKEVPVSIFVRVANNIFPLTTLNIRCFG